MDKTSQFLNNLPRVLGLDGGAAVKPNEAIIKNSIAFIKGLPTYYQKVINPNDCITATPFGTISIDWYFRRNFISVEVGESKIGWFTELPDGSNPSSQGVAIKETPPTEIIRCLDAIYSRRELKK